MRGATAREQEAAQGAQISIHAPHARSDSSSAARASGYTDFNPRSSCEERRSGRMSLPEQNHFNPRSSCEERHDSDKTKYLTKNFNPRSSCEERHDSDFMTYEPLYISIHAPHARSDDYNPQESGDIQISIHAPHARSDMLNYRRIATGQEFQSTLLMRGATSSPLEGRFFPICDFNPRSSCEERRLIRICIEALKEFQSTLLMRGATIEAGLAVRASSFQSTLLMRGATIQGEARRKCLHFNPRSSCEERPMLRSASPVLVVFQSTLLMRGATRGSCGTSSASTAFQSTLLMRGATGGVDRSIGQPKFQSTLLMRGATRATSDRFVCDD